MEGRLDEPRQPWVALAADRARPNGEWRREALEELPGLAELEQALAVEFPRVRVVGSGQHLRPNGVLAMSTALFGANAFDPQCLDRALATYAERGALRLVVLLDSPAPTSTILQILTRTQPYHDRRNGASSDPVFDRVLDAHRAIYDLDEPPARAEYAHAIDTWQWTLRLDPEASLPVQIAALFHEVERLGSETERRAEQGGDAASEQAHAQEGATTMRGALEPLALPPSTLERALELVTSRETPDEDLERTLLADAEALSFFSLQSARFMDHYGREPTRQRVARTIARMSPDARARLPGVRLRADVAAILEERARSASARSHCR